MFFAMLTLHRPFFPHIVNNQQKSSASPSSNLKITFARHSQQEIVSAILFIKSLELLNIPDLSSIGSFFVVFYNPMLPHVHHGLRGLPSRLWQKCKLTSEVWMPMRRSYVVPMRWMVIYEYGVPVGALNLNTNNYPDHSHHGNPPLSGKNPHGRAGNRTRDLMVSSQKH
jgi:hypothetical protein